MNYIATVNTPAHGTISVTYSDIEKNILGAWREEETIQLSGKREAASPTTSFATVDSRSIFEKLMSPPQIRAFISRFEAGGSVSQNSSSLQHRLPWIKTESGFDFTDQKQQRRVCGSPTMLLSAKTSFTKPVSTRGRSLAGSS
ncbi:hypothetical protein QM129_28375 [Klebsiella pneumoniae]|nr:hypothetical protein [Klebsiella pneumoniae]